MTYFTALNTAMAHRFSKPAVTDLAAEQLDWWAQDADLWRNVARAADPLDCDRAYDLVESAEAEANRIALSLPSGVELGEVA